MAFVNLYEPPTLPIAQDGEFYGPDPYDINFCFPISLEFLQSEKVTLTPFIPRHHALTFWSEWGLNSVEHMQLMPTSWPTMESMLQWVEHRMRRDPSCILFAVLDRTQASTPIAGLVGLRTASQEQLQAELSPLIVLPSAQRTHVTTHAASILARYALNTPAQGGLGLRRLCYRADPINVRSHAVARRLGFMEEGHFRWALVVEEGRQGHSSRPEDPLLMCFGRHAVQFALCWDTWEDGGKWRVAELLRK
jgi:RimJ/RimL family protein N-acetyltransferase